MKAPIKDMLRHIQIKLAATFLFLLLQANVLQAQQRSAYDLAAWIIAAVDDNDTNAINWALKEGGQIDFRRGETNALQFAIYKGRTNMITFLLAKGANIDSVNADGLSALKYAEKLGKQEVIEMIKNSSKGGTPLFTAKKDTASKKPLPIEVTSQTLVYKIGDSVLHSRDRGKTWEPGTIKDIATSAQHLADGYSPYLVENLAKTDQGYRDPSFITTLTRQPTWTTFFSGDWDLYLGLAVTERLIERDVYQIISGGTRLPPLQIRKDGSYS